MPFPETPDSGPFTEQRLIIVLRRRRLTINHTNAFVLVRSLQSDPQGWSAFRFTAGREFTLVNLLLVRLEFL